jgi:hypothetical protein
MAATAQYSEKIFIDELSHRLSQEGDWKVEKEVDDGSTDLIILDPQSGKRVFVEFQEGGQYGELPISSILSLSKQKNRLSGKDILFLVTFSVIPSLLENKLKELGIMAVAKPSVEELVGKLQYAMSA